MGEYYVPVLRGRHLLLHKLKLCLLSVVQALCVYAMGRANTPAFRQIYVILPFLALVFFTGRGMVSAFSFFTWRDIMTKRQYKASEMPFAQSQHLLPFLCAGLVLSETAFLLFGGALTEEWFVLLMAFLLAGLSLFAKHILSRGACVKQAQGEGEFTQTRLKEVTIQPW